MFRSLKRPFTYSGTIKEIAQMKATFAQSSVSRITAKIAFLLNALNAKWIVMLALNKDVT